VIKKEKIDEWIKEIEERPSSASLILEYIANRLRELDNRNDELMREVLDLRSEKRVEAYEKRIAHLEYQLELIKRHVGGASQGILASDLNSAMDDSIDNNRISILVYDNFGRVCRLEILSDSLKHEAEIGQFTGSILENPELPRLLAVSPTEEILFLFSSGRIATMSVSNIPALNNTDKGSNSIEYQNIDWGNVSLPVSIHGGERLTSLIPISRLALVDFFVQVSRRGYMKKIRIGMADSILQNHYIGTGVKKAPDQLMDVLLCLKEDQLVLISYEGYVLSIDVGLVPVAVEEVIHLNSTDHLVSVLPIIPASTFLIMTNAGKTVHITRDRIPLAESLKSRGKAILSSQRKSQGVKIVGAVCAEISKWGISLDHEGRLAVHNIQKLAGSGTIHKKTRLLAFSGFSFAGTEMNQ
jgi:DNA gyrase/topoisomerase IV subunit A